MTASDERKAGAPELPLSPEGILQHREAAQSVEGSNSATSAVVGFDSSDPRSRPFNMLRAQVIKMMRAKGTKIIGVTSATPKVGKSFVATNLAASLSKMPDIRTLLFDLDLRRGSIADQFSIPLGLGINSFLCGEIDTLSAASHGISETGLTVYPSFKTKSSSAELLAGSRFRSLVAAMRGLPENVICICDLPPAFANDDAAIVLREIDGYLFVVEEGKTTAHQVRDAIELLKPSICLGTVFNRYHGGIGGDDYGFGYGRQRDYAAYYS